MPVRGFWVGRDPNTLGREVGAMDTRPEENTTQPVSGEAERYRASAGEHLRQLREFWIIFAATGVVILVILAAAIRGGLSWFASNTRVNQQGAQVAYAGQLDFALATVGKKDQGVYDGQFDLTSGLPTETIGGTTYYIAAGNGSFRLNSDQNLNNYLNNADLRPGNRGNFDLYIIRRGSNSKVVLRPVFSAWYEAEPGVYQNAFSESAPQEQQTAAGFLTGHLLLFADMDEKGMYTGNIDMTQDVTLDFDAPDGLTASQGGRNFAWGECVYSDGNTAAYRLSVCWVWVEQFGNYVYTGNSYLKNLFADTQSEDYRAFLAAMNDEVDCNMSDEVGCKRFFALPSGQGNLPEISNGISTQVYELYSGWYDAADEAIGTHIAYVQLGFELRNKEGSYEG